MEWGRGSKAELTLASSQLQSLELSLCARHIANIISFSSHVNLSKVTYSVRHGHGLSDSKPKVFMMVLN